MGGAISIYDLMNKQLIYTHQNVVENHLIQSVYCSTLSPNLVWLGTSPYGESTSPLYIDEPAHLVLWDIKEQKIRLDIIPDEEARKIPYIVENKGKVYCITDAAYLYCFDINNGKQLGVNIDDGIKEILVNREGEMLGISDEIVLKIDPITLKTEVIAQGFSFLSNLKEDVITGNLCVFDETDLILLSNN